MDDVKNFVCDGQDYQTILFKGREVLRLNQKVLNIMARIVASKTSGVSKVTIGLEAISQSLGSLPDDEYQSLVESSLKNTAAVKTVNVSFSDVDTIGNFFKGKPMSMYEVLFKVWELNSFGPFVPAVETTGSSTPQETRALPDL